MAGRCPSTRCRALYSSSQSSEAERVEAAGACMLNLSLTMPMALDEMSNVVDTAYAALPERLYLIDAEGRIAYRSGPGPWGFDIDAWEGAIRETVD